MKEITLEDGSKIRNFTKIKEVAKVHYEALYIEQEGVKPYIRSSMLEHIPKVITQMENANIIKEIEESKIINAI